MIEDPKERCISDSTIVSSLNSETVSNNVYKYNGFINNENIEYNIFMSNTLLNAVNDMKLLKDEYNKIHKRLDEYDKLLEKDINLFNKMKEQEIENKKLDMSPPEYYEENIYFQNLKLDKKFDISKNFGKNFLKKLIVINLYIL